MAIARALFCLTTFTYLSEYWRVATIYSENWVVRKHYMYLIMDHTLC